MVYKFFDKSFLMVLLKVKLCQTKIWTEQLHKLIIRKLGKQKCWSCFTNNMWSADLADIQWISLFNKIFWFFLCTIDIYSKYACVVHLKDKKRITITNAFKKKFRWI